MYLISFTLHMVINVINVCDLSKLAFLIDFKCMQQRWTCPDRNESETTALHAQDKRQLRVFYTYLQPQYSHLDEDFGIHSELLWQPNRSWLEILHKYGDHSLLEKSAKARRVGRHFLHSPLARNMACFRSLKCVLNEEKLLFRSFREKRNRFFEMWHYKINNCISVKKKKT